MRRLLTSAIFVTSLTLVPVAAPPVVAQEASPAAATAISTSAVTVEPLGVLTIGPGITLPVTRVTLAPGVTLAPHTSPGAAVAQVESGEVSFVAISGVARRARLTVLPAPGASPIAGTPLSGATPTAASPMAGTPLAGATPTAGMPIDAYAVVEQTVVVLGEAVPLTAGEGIAFDTDVVHTFRNDGSTSAAILIVGEVPPAASFEAVAEDREATPTS